MLTPPGGRWVLRCWGPCQVWLPNGLHDGGQLLRLFTKLLPDHPGLGRRVLLRGLSEGGAAGVVGSCPSTLLGWTPA